MDWCLIFFWPRSGSQCTKKASAFPVAVLQLCSNLGLDQSNIDVCIVVLQKPLMEDWEASPFKRRRSFLIFLIQFQESLKTGTVNSLIQGGCHAMITAMQFNDHQHFSTFNIFQVNCHQLDVSLL